MAGEIRFHEEAIEIFGVAQVSEGQSAVTGSELAGTIDVTLGGTAVTGVGTNFGVDVITGDIIYTIAGVSIGRITSVTDTLNMTIEPAAVAVPALSKYAASDTITSGTLSVTSGTTAVSGAGTAYLTEAAPGAYLYEQDGTLIGQIKTVTDDSNLVLEANAPNTVTLGIYYVGLGTKNALAALNLTYSTELTSEAFTYVGDENNRDEDTVITDKFSKVEFETFLPSLGTLTTPGQVPLPSEVPMIDWLGSSGLSVDLTVADQAKFTNSVASNEFLTIEIRRSSPGITTQKTYTSTDNRGLVDLDATIGTRPKLKFVFNGNLAPVTQKFKILSDFGDQKSEHAPSLNSTNITQVELGVYNGNTPPTFAGGSNACFDKLLAPNFVGFEYTRFLTGCVDGWSKGGAASDVNITLLEDEAGATYNPDNHLEENHALRIKWGTIVGKKTQLDFTKLQLASVAVSTVAAYSGQDLQFRNTEYVDLILS